MAIITYNSGEKWERFPGSPQLNVNTISHLVDEGVWTWRDLNKHGLKFAAPFVVPDGKQIVPGSEYFSADGKQQLFDVVDVVEEPRCVPETLTPLQARKILRNTGHKQAVDAYIATLTEDEQEEWEYALEIRIDNPILVAGAQLLSLDLEQLFIDGAKL